MEKTLINVFATDLDGTLLNEEYGIDTYIENCLDFILQNNKELVVVTGRILNGVYGLTYFNAHPIYIIAMNGALVLDKNKNIIYKKTIGKDEIRDIYQHFKYIEYVSENKVYMSISKDEYIEYYGLWSIWKKRMKDANHLKYHLSQYVFNASLEMILNEDILKINELELDDDMYEIMLKYVEKYSLLKNAPFTNHVIELTNKAISKKDCLQYLCKVNRWNEDEVAVFGDGGNDIEMLSYFNNSFAPENAIDSVKQVAHKIVPSNAEYGVINEIIKLTA